MERRFEFQDLASLGAIGVGLAIGIKNAKSAGVTTDDIVRAYSNVTPIKDVAPIPLLEKTQMSQRDILSRIAGAVQIREDFNSRKLNNIIKGLATAPLKANELQATRFGLLEYGTSPQIDPQVRTQFRGGDDIGNFAADLFEMNEPQIREQVRKASAISTMSEQRRNLGNIIGNKSRSASRFKSDLNKVASVYDVKTRREKLPKSRAKKILGSMTANMSPSAVSSKNVKKYPLRSKILTLSSDFTTTFEFKGGAEDIHKQIENALESLNFKDKIGRSLKKEITSKFKQARKHIGKLKAQGIIPDTGNLSLTVMGMKGMDQPAIYLNLPFGSSVDESRGRVGFQIPLNRPSYISSRGTSTPVYFSTNQPRNPIALNAMTMRAASRSEMGNLQGGRTLVNTIDAVFFGGTDDVATETIPFYEAIINSKSTLLPIDNDPILNRAAAQQRGVPVEDVAERLRQGSISTVNPLDSLFGVGDDKAKYGQSVIGSTDDVGKSQVMVQRGRMIGITGLSELSGEFSSKELFTDIHRQLNNTIYNYGGKYSVLRINAASVSPGQVGIEKGGVSAVSFNLVDPEGAFGITQQEIKEAAEQGRLEDINQTIQAKLEEFEKSGVGVDNVLDEHTHFGLLEGTDNPRGFNELRRPSQPLIDVFEPTAESLQDLTGRNAYRYVSGEKFGTLFSPMQEFGVSSQDMPDEVRRTRINRRYLFLHPDAEQATRGAVASRIKSRLQEGISVAITDNVNPEFYGQSVKSKVFLGQTRTVLSERMQKVTEALFSLTEEERQDSTTRKKAIKDALYQGDEVVDDLKPKPVFKRGEFLGIKMDARSGLTESIVDFGGMPEYVLEDAYLDGDSLDLEFKPIINSQQGSKVMLSSKTTQVAMGSGEFVDAMGMTSQDSEVTGLLRSGRIDAVADATEIARRGNLNAIRSQQASAVIEVMTDSLERTKGVYAKGGVMQATENTKGAVALLGRGRNHLMAVMGGTGGSDYLFSNFENNLKNARSILNSRRENSNLKGLDPVFSALDEMLSNKRATASLLETIGVMSTLEGQIGGLTGREIFGIFGLEKFKTKEGQSLLDAFGAAQKRDKYHTGILGVMGDTEARKVTAEVLGELMRGSPSSLAANDTLEDILERIGTGLQESDVNTSFIRGQAASTFRTTAGIFEANQVSIERRAIHSLLNVSQFTSADGRIDFRNLFLEDLVTQIQGPSREEAILAGSLLGNNGLLDLAMADDAVEILSPATELQDHGRIVALPFLEGHVKDPTLYMPSSEQAQILRRNIQVGNQVLDKSYMGKIDEIKEIVGMMTPEDMASFDPNSAAGQNLINSFNQARVIGYSTATDINERFFSGAIIGSIYTLQQANYKHFDDNLRIADNLILKSSTKGGGLVTMINRREAERLLAGARRVAGEDSVAELTRELLEDKTPVLGINTRFPAITGTPRWASLVQYDPDLDYEINEKGSFYKAEVEGKTEYIPKAKFDESMQVMRNEENKPIAFRRVDTEVRRQGHAIAELIEGSQSKEVTIDAYMLSGTTTDFDGDNALANLYIGKNRKEVQDFLMSEEGRRQMLGYIYDQTSMQREYEDKVKTSPRMQGFENAAKQSGEVLDGSVRTLSQHAGQAEIGRVSSAITQLKLLATYGKEARVQSLGDDADAIKGIEGSYERFMAFLQGTEQVPISFKHSSAGETPAAKLTSEIMGIFSNTDQVEAEKAMSEFLMSWMGGDRDEVAKITSEWMENFMSTAVSYSVASEDIRAAIQLSTKHSEDIAMMSPEEFERIYSRGMSVSAMSAVTVTHAHTELQKAIATSALKGNDEIAALNNSRIQQANELNNKIQSSVAEQAKSATLNQKGKAFAKIATPVGAGLVAAGLIYAMFDQGQSADNLEEPEGRKGLRPPAGIRMNNPQRDTNLNAPYEDRETNYAPNTIDRRTVGSSNTGRINSRAQISQNVNALEVARAMQTTIPHAQIGVNVQYSNKMNPRLEQDL
jgi:hypothetical protein